MRDVLLVLAGGGLAAAILKFVEFLLSRKFQKDDKKESYVKRDEFKKGLEDREATGKQRFDINSKAIAENTEQIAKLAVLQEQTVKNVTLLTENISQLQEHNIHVGDAINGIVHDRILHNVNDFVNRTAITTEEISTLKSMYYPYKKLGGNGDVETAFEVAMKLPVITKEDADKRDKEIKRSIVKD